MDLDMASLEPSYDAFTIAKEATLGIRGALPPCAGAGGRCCQVIVVKASKNDDLLAGHEHEVLRVCGRVVHEGGAGSNAALLERETGPSVERVSVHDRDRNSGRRVALSRSAWGDMRSEELEGIATAE